MKRFWKITALTALLIVSLVFAFACGGDSGEKETGLKFKVFSGDEYYTLYEYDGEDVTLEIPAEYKGKKVGRIKKGAFEGNATVKTLVVPSSVETIEGGAFGKMVALEEITLPFVGINKSGETHLNDNNASDKDKAVDEKRTFAYLFSTSEYDGGVKVTGYKNDTDSGTAYYLPSNLSTVRIVPAEDYGIPACAFKGNGILTKVVFGDKVTEIGEYAFDGCDLLMDVEIKKGITAIDKYAFSGCKALKTLAFESDSSLKTIGAHAFEANGFNSLVLPEGLETIGESAFSSKIANKAVSVYSTISEITLPKSLKTVGRFAFFHCEKLVAVNVAEGASVDIKDSAFASCTALRRFDSDTDFTISLTKVNEVCALAFGSIELPEGKAFKVIYGGSSSLENAFDGTEYSKI